MQQTSAEKIVEAPSVDESTKRASNSTNGKEGADAKPKSKWGKVGSVMKLVGVTGSSSAINVQEESKENTIVSEKAPGPEPAAAVDEEPKKNPVSKQGSKWGKVGAVMKLANVKPVDPARDSTESLKKQALEEAKKASQGVPESSHLAEKGEKLPDAESKITPEPVAKEEVPPVSAVETSSVDSGS